MEGQVNARRGYRPGAHRTGVRSRRRRALIAGGPEGNERLTVVTGLVLIMLLAVLGVTIVRIGQLLWLHLFLGLVLIGPILLKLASTGYRFLRYYTANPPYRRKGPPAPVLRLLAPGVVLLTMVVFATGVVLLLVGPGSSLRSTIFLLHKASFIGWLVLIVVHIAGHLPELVRFNRISATTRSELNDLRAALPGLGGPAEPPLPEHPRGRSGRWLSLGAAMVFGLAVALVLLPQFGAWTGAHALFHHHHELH
jgi:hypothetical protein